MSGPVPVRQGGVGYFHPTYAASLNEFGRPRHLRRTGAWVLERPLEGLPYRDAMGCYPLFSCGDWSKLEDDLEDLEADLVSISLVADPFGSYDPKELRRLFHRFLLFKVHFVADLSRRPEQFVSRHHRYYSRWALRRLKVEAHLAPGRFLDEWVSLYSNLIQRHNLKGIAAFSRHAFAAQLSVPGMILLRATCGQETVGAHLWCLQDGVAQSHLSAFSDRGYETMASYALYWTALEFFRDKAKWLNFGGAAGVDPDERDGLANFKRGWASETRNAYFCGRILNPDSYAKAAAQRGVLSSSYFPEYRDGQI
jgi:hypothetical protein